MKPTADTIARKVRGRPLDVLDEARFSAFLTKGKEQSGER